jgi:ferric-dicitrate binding protein FerR (iron transport regulator)
MQYAAWREGKLIFVDEKLDIAVKKLSRWYNVNIILANDVLKNMPITATFQKEQLMQTLNLLKKALPIRYEVTGEKQQADDTYSRKQIKIYADM